MRSPRSPVRPSPRARGRLDGSPRRSRRGDRGGSAPSVALGRVLALSESRRRLLYELVSLSDDDRASVSAATETIASRKAVDLSPSTVRRVLYELADAGLLDRVTARRATGRDGPESARPAVPDARVSGAVRPALVVGLIRLHRLFLVSPLAVSFPSCANARQLRAVTSHPIWFRPSRWTSTGR